MTKDQVRKMLGDPSIVPGTVQMSPTEKLEVWEYVLDNGFAPDYNYWLMFTNGKLTKWRDSKDCEDIRQLLRKQ